MDVIYTEEIRKNKIGKKISRKKAEKTKFREKNQIDPSRFRLMQEHEFIFQKDEKINKKKKSFQRMRLRATSSAVESNNVVIMEKPRASHSSMNIC